MRKYLIAATALGVVTCAHGENYPHNFGGYSAPIARPGVTPTPVPSLPGRASTPEMELGNWIAMFIGRQENSATGPYHEYNVPIKVWAESRRACELTIVESIAVPAWNVKKRWDGSVDPGDIHRTESAITFPLTIDPDQIKDVDKIPILILDHIYPAQAIRTNSGSK